MGGSVLTGRRAAPESTTGKGRARSAGVGPPLRPPSLPPQTRVHYDVEAWEGRAYEYGVEALRQMGVPVDGLRFDSSLVIRG